MPAKITNQLLWFVLPDKYFFDVVVLTNFTEAFSVWGKEI